jgi:hypothetical protein
MTAEQIAKSCDKKAKELREEAKKLQEEASNLFGLVAILKGKR